MRERGRDGVEGEGGRMGREEGRERKREGGMESEGGRQRKGGRGKEGWREREGWRRLIEGEGGREREGIIYNTYKNKKTVFVTGAGNLQTILLWFLVIIVWMSLVLQQLSLRLLCHCFVSQNVIL